MAASRFKLRESAVVALTVLSASVAACEASSPNTERADGGGANTDGPDSNGADGGDGHDGDHQGNRPDAGEQNGSDADSGTGGGRPDGGEPDGPDSSTDPGGAAANRAASIPIGIENVNDSPMKSASYRTLLRFVPDSTITIDRFYFGFKLRGADCWDDGSGYGAGDGGLLYGSLVNIDPQSGLPTTEIAAETINGCTRHNEAKNEFGATPVLAWVNTEATLVAGTMYGLIVSNAHDDPEDNFFSFNMPLADTALAGPHARNELNRNAAGGLLSLDPREHVAWSDDEGSSWQYGSANGQYRSYMNDHDQNHEATRMPQYGFRLADGTRLAGQPYYAYSDDCAGCTVTHLNARYARTFTEVGGFTAGESGVGTLTFTNTSTDAESSCTPVQGYGFGKCTLPEPISVAVGESYTVRSTGSVEIMHMDHQQRMVFPQVGSKDGELRAYQSGPAPVSNPKNVPNLWAGPLSANFPAPGDL